MFITIWISHLILYSWHMQACMLIVMFITGRQQQEPDPDFWPGVTVL